MPDSEVIRSKSDILACPVTARLASFCSRMPAPDLHTALANVAALAS